MATREKLVEFCPKCGKRYVSDESKAGTRVKCQKLTCGATFVLPGKAIIRGPRPGPRPKPKVSTLKTVVVSLICLLTIGSIVLGTVLIIKKKKSSSTPIKIVKPGDPGPDPGPDPDPGHVEALAKLPVKKMVCRVVPGVKLSIKGRTIERWGDIYEIQNRSELLALSEWEKKHLLRVYKPPAKPDLDIPSMHGSGFLISDDGHILTNQHNVEIWKHLQKNPDILRRFARHEGYDSMTAQVWVIFDDKAYEAQLVHVSKKFDMAVLRAPDYTKEARLKRGEKEKDIAKFPLSASNDVPPISTIHVLGFPGLGEVARTPEERAARQLRMKDHRKIVEAFSGNQLTMSNSAGAFGKIKNDSERGRIMQYLLRHPAGIQVLRR